jgi:RNA polymerase sigma factor (sigma-70 family)
MSKSSTAVLGKAIRSAFGGESAGRGDGELLRRFAEGGDQAAFAVLFRRHSGMVLGVCRRALASEQDAEDACQATFLVLSRKARSGRWQQSVANWLYLTARRVAHNARVAAERRARRESRAAVSAVVQPVDRMTGRGLLDLLDLELDNLPPSYREPLVLCYLEGLTRDEAAARLGIPAATVKIRLERGRKRLGDALAKHGCVLGTGLLALAATSPARACSGRFLQGALATLAGSPRRAVVELADGVAAKAGGRIKLLLTLAGVCLLGVGLAANRPEKLVPAVPEALAEGIISDPSPAADRGQTVSLKGRVIGVDGKPFAGAKLLLVKSREAPVDLGVSGPDGRFSLTLPKDQRDKYLLARAEGLGFDFRQLGSTDPADGAGVEFRLVKDHAIRGRIVDTQGQPVAGVRVRVDGVYVYKNDSLDTYLRLWTHRDPRSGCGELVNELRADVGSVFSATTDADGRFTLTGLGAERLVRLRTEKPGIAEAEYWSVNRANLDPAPYNAVNRKMLADNPGGPVGAWRMHGPVVDGIAEAEKPVRGVVTAADTGKGRPGVVVRLTRGQNDLLRTSPLETTTDANGRYEIRGARKAKKYMVEVDADTREGYMPAQRWVDDTSGYDSVVADLRVNKGVLVTGRLFDRVTGKGIRGLVMAVAAVDNPFAKDFTKFNEGLDFPEHPTADDGSFRIVTIPGPVIFVGRPDWWEMIQRYKLSKIDPNYPQYFPAGGAGSFIGYGGGYYNVERNWCKVLNLRPGVVSVVQDMPLEPLPALQLLLRDPAGKPVKGVAATGTAANEKWPEVWSLEGTCPVYGLEPGRSRRVVLYHARRNLAATLVLKGDEQSPVVVTLQPAGALKGRLVGPAGQPLAGVEIEQHYKDRPAETLGRNIYESRPVVTGPDGSFKVDSILPGLAFELSFKLRQKLFKPATKPASPLTVESGVTKDVGSLCVVEVGKKAKE